MFRNRIVLGLLAACTALASDTYVGYKIRSNHDIPTKYVAGLANDVLSSNLIESLSVDENPSWFIYPTGIKPENIPAEAGVKAVIFYVPIPSDYLNSGSGFEKTACYRKKLYMEKYGWHENQIRLVPVKSLYSDYQTWEDVLVKLPRGTKLKIIEAIGHSGGLDIAGMPGLQMEKLHLLLQSREIINGIPSPIDYDTEAFFIGCRTAGVCDHEEHQGKYKHVTEKTFACRFSRTFGVTASGSTAGMCFYHGAAGKFKSVLSSQPFDTMMLGAAADDDVSWPYEDLHWRSFWNGIEIKPQPDIYLTRAYGLTR
jgi:hypothetical protein